MITPDFLKKIRAISARLPDGPIAPSLLDKYAGQAYEELDRNINYRATLKRQIEKFAVDGKVGVWEAGRDCDGSRYSRYARTIDASLLEFLKAEKHAADWADGPFSYTPCPPYNYKYYGGY